MIELLIYYYFLPVLFSCLLFNNVIWIIKNLNSNKDIKIATICGSILTILLTISFLFSFHIII